MFGFLFGDNFYETPRTAIARATGVHRMAALLRKHDFAVEVVDFFNSWSIDELIKLLDACSEIDFIGFGLSLSPLDVRKTTLLIEHAKKLNPNIKIIAGGSSILNTHYAGIDLFFKGFTEGAIEDIVKFLHTGKFNPFNVETINTHDVKKVVNCTDKYPKFDLSRLKNQYIESDFISHTEALTLETSRGCIFKCKFCSFPLIGKKKNDYIRKKEDIKQELIDNYTQWGTTRYSITDDTFNDNEIKVDMIYEISQELDFELSFMSYARIDLFNAKQGSLDKLVRAGFKGFFFGIESLNELTSRKIGKGLTGEKLKNYLNEIRCKYPSLHISASFILGLPHEPPEIFHKNIDWALGANVFDSYAFYPLGIPLDNKINYMSPFSTEWQNYGYEIMTDAEIEEKVKNSPPEHKLKEFMDTYDYHYKHHSLPWKNEQMDFLDAIVHTELSHRKTGNQVKLGGWYAIAHAFNNPTLDEVFRVRKSEINWEKQAKDTENFVNQYKIKKLEYNNQNTFREL